ncbi:hypothetical protein FRB96_009369 [Tulasnella sp. 330]|nr:hypothetical protein FRB96_009369 [Tulasnella sp. 330]KAG8882376.1 hypothetical protein FRB98_003756 [Tulasnella sp. 332]KAG8885285.1 hypothetical protein FRB97_001731 [Tulasnella sp. 331]
MANDMVTIVDSLFPGENTTFFIAGHDRGARVAYRLALDPPRRMRGVCVMYSIPFEQFGRMRLNVNKDEETLKQHHWIFLALPPPLLEMLIGHDPEEYFRFTIDN